MKKSPQTKVHLPLNTSEQTHSEVCTFSHADSLAERFKEYPLEYLLLCIKAVALISIVHCVWLPFLEVRLRSSAENLHIYIFIVEVSTFAAFQFYSQVAKHEFR